MNPTNQSPQNYRRGISNFFRAVAAIVPIFSSESDARSDINDEQELPDHVEDFEPEQNQPPNLTCCGKQFNTSKKLKNHEYDWHWPSVTIDNQEFRREADGLFKCPVCLRRFRTVSNFRKFHLGCLNRRVNVVDANRNRFSVQEFAERNGLILVANGTFIICKDHSLLLGTNYSSHLRSKHGLSLTQEEKNLVSPYTQNIQNCPLIHSHSGPFNVIEDIPFCEGFRCNQCNAASKSKFHLKHFPECTRPSDSIVRSKLQYIHTGRKRVPFGVAKASIIDERNADLLENVIRDNTQIIQEHIEPPNAEDQFYRPLGWFTDADQEMWPLNEIIAVNSIAKASSELTPLKVYMQGLIAGVNGINPNLRELIFDENNFGIKSIADSKSEYATTFARFLCFLVAFASHERFSSILNEEEREAINLLRRCTNPSTQARTHILGIWRICCTQDLDSNREDLVRLFIKFQCLKSYRHEETGQVHLSLSDAANVEKLCAKMMYFCRLYHIAALRCTSTLEFNSVKEEVIRITGLKLSPLRRLFGLKGRAMKFASADLVKVRLIPTDDPAGVIIEGKPIQKSQLVRLTSTLIKNIKEDLKYLTFELDWESLEVMINDDMCNNVPGFGIFSSNQESQVLLFDHVLRDRVLLERITSVTENANEFQFKSSFIDEYKSHYERSMKWLMILVHLCSGMPGRASEVCSMKITNSNGHRNVFFIDGRFVFYTVKNKTNTITDKNSPVFRFLPKCLSKLFYTLVVIVRSFFVRLQLQETNNRAIVASSFTYLYPSGHTHVSGENYCRTFSRVFKSITGIEILLSEWRHLAKYYAKKFLRIDLQYITLEDQFGNEEGRKQDDSFVEDLQAGHSSQTARAIYGRKITESLERDEIFDEYKLVSTLWQKFLNVGTDAQDMQQVASQRLAVVPNPVQRTENAAAQKFITVVQSRSVMEDLTSLTGLTSFKSLQQKSAAELIVATKTNLIVVLPTGGGKSLLFTLYALKYSTSHATLIIVPTNALKDQVTRDLRAASERLGRGQLSVETDLDAINHANVIVLTPDKAVFNGNDFIIKQLTSSGRIQRIFIDEAHCAYLDADFRDAYDRLTYLADTTASLTFLTATMAPETEEGIKNSYGRGGRNFKVIRGSINCPNLSLEQVSNANVATVKRQVASFLMNRQPEDRAIIYVHSRSAVDSLLQAIREPSTEQVFESFKGGMNDAERNNAYQNWASGEKPVVIATSAFGLGINYPAVRLVISYGLPYTLEEYVQQIGRAGRDGNRSQSILMTLQVGDNFAANETMKSFGMNDTVCMRRWICEMVNDELIDCESSRSIECQICRRYGVGRQENAAAGPQNIDTAMSERRIGQVARVPIANAVEATNLETQYNETVFNMEPETLMQRFLDRLREYQDICPYCAIILRQRCSHSERSCPLLRTHCYSCLKEGHQARNCSFKWLQFPEGNYFICFICWLPRSANNNFHDAQNRCIYKDVLKTFAALKYIKDEANPDLAKQRILAWLISREEAQNRLLKEFIQFSDQNPFRNIASRR